MAHQPVSTMRRSLSLTATLVLAAALALVVPAADAARPTQPALSGQASSYSGDAGVIDLSATLLGNPLLGLHLVHAGPLPSSGGSDADELLTLSNPAPLALQADVGLATTLGSGQLATSFASVAALSVGIDAGVTDVADVSASVLQSTSRAECVNGAAVLSGGANLLGASISVLGSAPIVLPVNPAPNTTIDVGGLATLTLNEQIKSPGSITVNALHLEVNAVGLATVDLVISHSHSDIACSGTVTPTCSVKDFVTGGGYVMRNGEKVTFAVHGGLAKDGTFRPSGVNLVDHGNGLHVKAKTLDAYADPAPVSTKRVLHFSDGNWTVSVADNGEPGRNDTFRIANGSYAAGSTETAIAGGNIQLHQPKGCSTTGGGKGPKPH